MTRQTFLATAVIALLSASTQAAHVRVVLLGGQSNMEGQGTVADLPLALQSPQTDVLLYGNNVAGISGSLVDLQPAGAVAGRFGPEVTFGRTIADTHPAQDFALIKYAVSGTSLEEDWDPTTGGTYSTFKTTVTDGLAALTTAGHTHEIIGMLWMQGESDALEGFASNYEANLTAFIADVRANYGSELKFVIGQLSPGQTFIPAGPLADVIAAQANVAVADPNTVLVDTSTYNLPDNLHFDSAGQVALGEAFASAFDVAVPEPHTMSICAVAVMCFLGRRKRARKTRFVLDEKQIVSLAV